LASPSSRGILAFKSRTCGCIRCSSQQALGGEERVARWGGASR
jgi:hypothetical protein